MHQIYIYDTNMILITPRQHRKDARVAGAVSMWWSEEEMMRFCGCDHVPRSRRITHIKYNVLSANKCHHMLTHFMKCCVLVKLCRTGKS